MSTCIGEESRREGKAICDAERREASHKWCLKSYEAALEYTVSFIGRIRPQLSPDAELREAEKVRFCNEFVFDVIFQST